MGKTTIRTATYDDLDVLMELTESMHAESPRYSRMAFSHQKMINLYVMLIDSAWGLVLIAERDGVIIGGVAAMVTEHWLSNDMIASEFGLFILPEHRGGMTAARLARGYIEWAKEQGAKMIQFGISTGVHTDETAALYRAIGLKQFSIGFEV